MAATAEQTALAADPGTDARTLAELAHAEPELWPLIAVHPNVEPALVEWIRQHEPPHTPPVTSNPPSTRPAAASGPTPARTPTSLLERMSRRAKILTGVGIVAVALIAALVVAPQLRAGKAAAASAKAADQARATAVSAFDTASLGCASANKAMTAAQKDAQAAAATDPATMDDPKLLDRLVAGMKDAQAVTACTAPTQASDTGSIQAQADDLGKAASAVQSAANILADQVASVAGSVQNKKNAAAQAAQAASDAATAAALAEQQAKDAAATAARTWHFTSNDGYTFDVTLQAGAPVTDDSFTYAPAGSSGCNINPLPGQTKCETVKLAGVCTDFDPSTMIAVPVTATFTATTKGFDTTLAGNFAIRSNGTYQGSDATASSQVELATVYSDGGHCLKPNGSGAGPTMGVSWDTPAKTGTTETHHFDVILQKWRTPAAPSGDRALLDYLTVTLGNTTVSGTTTTYTPDSRKALTLNGAVVGG